MQFDIVGRHRTYTYDIGLVNGFMSYPSSVGGVYWTLEARRRTGVPFLHLWKDGNAYLLWVGRMHWVFDAPSRRNALKAA